MTKLFLALVVWLTASVASAVTVDKYPCSPMFLADPQGRPLPLANVSVTDLNNVQQTVYLTTGGGGATTNPVVPPNQVLQFYVDIAGEYITTVVSSGTTKQYWVSCGLGFGDSVALVSIDRTADLLLLSTTNPPALGCPNNMPCNLQFAPDDDQFAIFDFVMPSGFALDFQSARLVWHRGVLAGSGSVVWSLNWCVYIVGEIPCDPTLAVNEVKKTTTAGGSMIRVDTTWDVTLVAAGAWPEAAHVVVALTREGLDASDTLTVPVEMENIQLEFLRQ